MAKVTAGALITSSGQVATGAITSDDILNETIVNEDISPSAAIAHSKLANVSATARALGRNTAGAGAIEEVTLSQILDWIGSAAQGDILYRGASAWAKLAAGTSGQFLSTGGAGANPSWANGAAKTRAFSVSVAKHNVDAAPYSGVVGNHAHALCDSAEKAYFVFVVPNDFSTLSKVTLACVSPAGYTNTITINMTGATTNTSDASISDSLTTGTITIASNTFEMVDISAAFDGLAANHVISVMVTANANSLGIVSLLFEYNVA